MPSRNTIWEYNGHSDPKQERLTELMRQASQQFGSRNPGLLNCAFCRCRMVQLSFNEDQTYGQAGQYEDEERYYDAGAGGYSDWDRRVDDDTLAVHVCNTCGWWNVLRRCESSAGINPQDIEVRYRYQIAWGTLKKLDLSDVNTPLEELRAYLLAKYDDRFLLAPNAFEDIVAGVFRDFGYSVRVTGRSGDDGIDVVVLDGKANDVVGVQVKRYRGKIEAEQIRSFAGALLLKEMPEGIFVTTSSFTKGAKKTAAQYFTLQRGVPIDLVDGSRFYDYLQLTRRQVYTDAADPSSPFYRWVKNPETIPEMFYTWEIY